MFSAMAIQKNDDPCPPHHKNVFQPPPDNLNVQAGYYGNWNGVMLLAAIGCLFTVFVTTIMMYYIYFRVCSSRVRSTGQQRGPWRTEISRARRFSWRSVDGYYFTASPTNEGLSAAAVEALPVFVFKAEEFKDGMRCAVCLCEFEENEKGRVLPNCGHRFHVECIDMWFYSHSTCPLCRQGVETVVEVEDWSAEDKVGSAFEGDGVEERKEMEGERSGEAVAIVVAPTEESPV